MSCDCDFSNDGFMKYIAKLKKKHKNKNYNFSQAEILKFMTLHLKDNTKIKNIIMKKSISLQEMKLLNTKCCGIVNLELTGSGEVKNNKLVLYLNNKNIFLNLKTKIPNADADLSRKIVWHMHPWNISVDHEDDAPSFFSYEDIRISVNFPKKIFLIFNMHVKNPKIPVIYVVTAEDDVKKQKAKRVIGDIFDDTYAKLVDHKNYNIDLKGIKKKLAEIGVHFYYLMRYDEKSLVKIIMENCNR